MRTLRQVRGSFRRAGLAVCAVLALLGSLARPASGQCGGWLAKITGRPVTIDLTAVVWANERFTALGDRVEMSSQDGSSWNVTGLSWSSPVALAASDQSLLAVTGPGRAILKPFGQNWREFVLPIDGPSVTLKRVAWGNGSWAIVGQDTGSAVFLSPDGTTWHRRALPWVVDDIVYAGNRFLALIQSPDADWQGSDAVAESLTGETWAVIARIPVPAGSSRIASDGRTIVAAGGTALAVFRGIAWMIRSVPSGSATAVAFANGRFTLAVESTNLVGPRSAILGTSTDGEVFTWQALPTSEPLAGIAGSSARLVGVGLRGAIAATSGSSEWQTAFAPRIQALATDGDTVVASGVGTMLELTPDFTWAPTIRGTFPTLRRSGGRFVGLDVAGRVAESLDGNLWTTWPLPVLPRATGAGPWPLMPFDVVWRPAGYLLAAGWQPNCTVAPCPGAQWSGAAALSYNLISWSTPVVMPAPAFRLAASDWRVVGIHNEEMLTSDNGMTWSREPSLVNDAYREVLFTGAQFVAFRDKGVSLSPDGLGFQPVAGNAPTGVVAATMIGAEIMAVGGKVVATSRDGHEWTTKALSSLTGIVALAGTPVRQFVATDQGTLFIRDCAPILSVRRHLGRR